MASVLPSTSRTCPFFSLLLVVLLQGACQQQDPPSPPILLFEDGGIRVDWKGGPAVRLMLRDAQGLPLTEVSPPQGSRSVYLPLGWDPSTEYAAELWPRKGPSVVSLTRAPDPEGPLRIRLLAPYGQDRFPLADARTTVLAPQGGAAEVGVEVFPPASGGATVSVVFQGRAGDPPMKALPGLLAPSSLGESVHFTARLIAGGPPLQVAVDIPVSSSPVRTVDVGVEAHSDQEPPSFVEVEAIGELSVKSVSKETLSQTVEILDWRFPADALGRPLVDRPDDTLHLPADWWAWLARAAGATIRVRDAWDAWGYDSLTLANRGKHPLSVVVSERILLQGTEQEAPAFRPPMRDGTRTSGAVSQIVRISPGKSSTCSIPVHVRRDVQPGRYDREIAVSVSGLRDPLWVRRSPLEVHRGDASLALAFTLGLFIGLSGLVFFALKHRHWLGSRSTTELMTISLFGTALFVTGFASDLLSVMVSAVLGPFQVLVLGLFQDLLRYALIATLLLLCPRPGTSALALCTGYGLQALAVGGLSPVNLLFLGSGIALQEGLLWTLGVTRGNWASSSSSFRRQWPPLALALTLSAMAQAYTSLALHAVLYRLFFAPWYVALVVLVPSGLYVLIATAAGLRLGRSLREVAP